MKPNIPLGSGSIWFHTKFIFLTAFVIIDLYLNSQSEAIQPLLFDLPDDDKFGNDSSIEAITQLQMILFVCTILVQVSIFSVVFLILSDTYPFQVGLISVLANRFKFQILAHPIYVSLGIMVRGMRLRMIFVGANTNVWSNSFYLTFSFVHKIVAPCFYASQFRAALALGDEIYFTKNSWIRTQSRLAGG
ncbi:hypothetical protein ACHAXS_011014 [Conticribra weissflogii]